MKIFAFIPARYDSTRFPGKPLKSICGKPMIQHVYERAKAARQIAELYVTTDDERIYQCVLDFGGKAILTGRDHTSGTDRIAEAASKTSLTKDDLVVNIQGDQPTMDYRCISYLIRPFIDNRDVLMSTLVFRVADEEGVNDPRNPKHVKTVMNKEGFALFFSRAPIPYYRDPGTERIYFKHLGFYAYRSEFLRTFASLPVGESENAEKLEQLRAVEYGYKIKIIESPYDSFEVDHPDDIRIAESILAKESAQRR